MGTRARSGSGAGLVGQGAPPGGRLTRAACDAEWRPTQGIELGRIYFFARELGGSLLPAKKSKLSIRAAGAHESDRLLECSSPRVTRDLILDRFQRGDECFVAEDRAGRCVHTGWLTTTNGYIPELDMTVVLRPGEAYLYNAYAPPDRRGLGAFGLVLDFIFDRLVLAGFTRAYSYVRADNLYGLTGAPRRLSPVGVLWYLRIGDRRLTLGRRTPALPILVRRGDRRSLAPPQP